MMFLLDTHVVLWWLTDDPTLSASLKDRLAYEPDVFVSIATIWEIAIKQASGKLSAGGSLPEIVRDSGFRNLPVIADHVIRAGELPPIHRDPFDRLLIAQALDEGCTLVSRDRDIRRYDVPLLVA
jgi:PIN domain nuclease of toxin-antitoxin system